MVNIYQPLTREEVYELLVMARNNSSSCQTVANIQVRLEDGIPGMTSPHGDLDSPAMVKADRLASLFVEGYKTRDLSKLADEIFALMGNDYLEK